MRVFLIGAAGGVGRRLTPLLVAAGDHVTGMHRSPDQAAAVAASGAVPVAGDLIADTPEALAARMEGHDAVVFSAGAHGTGTDRTTLIDGEGVTKAAAAAALAGVRRLVLVSAFPEAGRGGEPREGFEHYMRTKKAADIHLAATDLDWVIVRPGHLTDAPGDGRVTAGVAVPYGEVPRDDVAALLAAVLHRPDLGRIIIELVDGPTPAEEAVATLVSRLAMPRRPL